VRVVQSRNSHGSTSHGSTTCKWLNAARTTSARCASWHANLAERAWRVMNRATPYEICDIDGRPVTARRSGRDHCGTLDRSHRRSSSPPKQEGEGPPSHLNETTSTRRPPPTRIVNPSRPRRQRPDPTSTTTHRLTTDPTRNQIARSGRHMRLSSACAFAGEP
jgi:hypothetical protein